MVEYGGKDELWSENTDGALKKKEEALKWRFEWPT